MKSNQSAQLFYDSYGIVCVECPRCRLFIPNVVHAQIVDCHECKLKFKVWNAPEDRKSFKKAGGK